MRYHIHRSPVLSSTIPVRDTFRGDFISQLNRADIPPNLDRILISYNKQLVIFKSEVDHVNVNKERRIHVSC